MSRVGVDVGGTFTDLILTDDATGRVMTHKVASTPQDQSIGVMQGIQELCNLAVYAAGRYFASVTWHDRGDQHHD